MTAWKSSIARWGIATALAATLAACGGGGGGSDPPPPPDARNGTYTLTAADAYVYELALDFDARTYHVTGNGMDQSGAITEQGGNWLFQPGNASGASGASTTRFQVGTDMVVGELAFPRETAPFIGARKFAQTAAAAAGTYDMVGRVVDTAGGAPDAAIQQGEITADGYLRVCNDNIIYDIPNCPAPSLAIGTLTVSGNLFKAMFTTGSVEFRVAEIGTDKVYLRSSASLGTTRRFAVGVPTTSGLGSGTFEGGTTEPAWGSFTLTTTTFSSSGTTPAGASTALVGTPVGGPHLPGLAGITTSANGHFFAVRAAELGVVVAAKSNPVMPGYVAIGRRQ